MVSTTRVCRLCEATTPAKMTVHLFNANGMKQKWGSRIHTLLGVSVDVSDGISPYMCNMCQTRLVTHFLLLLLLFRDHNWPIYLYNQFLVPLPVRLCTKNNNCNIITIIYYSGFTYTGQPIQQCYCKY